MSQSNWWEFGQSRPSWAADPDASPLGSATEKSRIETALHYLYDHSPTANITMYAIVSSYGFLGVAGSSFSHGYGSSAPIVAFNVAQIDDLFYFNDQGSVVKEKFELSIAHELLHVTTAHLRDPIDANSDGNKDDADFNTPNYDHKGKVLPLQNDVADELGFSSNHQATYFAAALDPDARIAAYGTKSWSRGATVDVVRWGDATNNQIDHSSSSNNTRDLGLGDAGDDTIKLGGGDDFGYGGVGSDTVDGGDANDVLFGEAGDDSLAGGAGNDDLTGGLAPGLSVGAASSDGNDTLAGAAGADDLKDEYGENNLDGGDDADHITVIEAKNTVEGGHGNDLIDLTKVPAGSDGGDAVTVKFNVGDGHDYIQDAVDPINLRIEAQTFAGGDIRLDLDSSNRVLVHQSGSADLSREDPLEWDYEVDVYLRLGSDTIYVGKGVWHEQNGFDGQLEFAGLTSIGNHVTVANSDGETALSNWIELEDNQSKISEHGFQDIYDDALDDFFQARGNGTAGPDTMSGSAGDDLLHGGGDADQLSGGAGNDQVDGGSGDDVLTGGDGADRIVGGAGNDVAAFSGVQADYTFARQADGALLVHNTASNAIDLLYDVESLRFGGGADVAASTFAPLDGTRGRDEIANTASGQTVHGFRGDDVITLTGANNTVDGGDGTDLVVLSGQQVDYELTRLADGSFTARHVDGSGTDLLVDVESLAFGSADNDVSVRSLLGDYGTPEDDDIEGTDSDDRLWALGGDDFMFGGDGDDTLNGGAGNDVISGGEGVDTVNYDGDEEDYTVTAGGGGAPLGFVAMASADNSFTVVGPDGTDALEDVEIIYFAGSGTALVPGADDGIVGTSASETLAGTAGADIISPGAGNDTIDGGAGSDLVVLTGSRSDYRFDLQADGALVVTHLGSAEADVVRNVEKLWFTTDHQLVTTAGLTSNHIPTATPNSATVSENQTVTIDVLANDTDPDAGDTLSLISVSATALGGHVSIVNGKAVFVADADAFDLLKQPGTLVDSFTYQVQDNHGAVSTGTVNVTVRGIADAPARNGTTGNDTLTGTNSLDETLNGLGGNDKLLGLAGTDTLDGGIGNDTLSGGVGIDRFVFTGTFGKDVVTDFESKDVIRLDAAQFANFAAVQSHAAQVGSDVVITLDAANTITLQNVTLGSLNAGEFLFV